MSNNFVNPSTQAYGIQSHAEGTQTLAHGYSTHAEGIQTIAFQEGSHAEGGKSEAQNAYAHAEGYKTIASGVGAHSEGMRTIASGDYSHAEGTNTEASGSASHAEGGYSKASGPYSHVSGWETQASGECSYAEGELTRATGRRSHAEGNNTKATGEDSHSEGFSTTASGTNAHAEGSKTTASGSDSHAEGAYSVASGGGSHAQNAYTIANGVAQTAMGKFNIADTTSALIIGNGTADNARSNALTIDWNGNTWLAGKITQGSPSEDATIINMNRMQKDLFVSGDGSAPNSPKVAGFYLGKSTSDENRHMDIVSGADYAYIDFNKAAVVEDYKVRLIANVTTGLTEIHWGSSATNKRLNVNGRLFVAGEPVDALEVATKSYVDKQKVYRYDQKVTANGTSQVVFSGAPPELNAHTGLVYYNGLLLYLGENYTVSSSNTIVLSGWTANNGDLFTITGLQADENALTVAGRLSVSAAGSVNQPVYFNNGVPVPTNPMMQMVSDGSYWGMKDPGGGTAGWIRTTTNGIIPISSGGASNLGTSSWPFLTVHAKNFYGAFNGNATSATKATQDGNGSVISSTYAKLASWNNLIHSGNEFTFVPGSYGGAVWLNYRTASGSCDGSITQYNFGDGKGGSLASIANGQFSGNAATATALTSSAGSAGQAIYFASGKPVALDWRMGNSSTGEHNCNNVTYNFCGYYTSNGPATSIGATTTDGSLWAQAYNSTWVTQIAQDYRDGDLFVRGKNSGSWTAWKRIWATGDSVTGAVWNDYAECREADTIEPGYVLVETGDDSLTKSIERLSPFAGVSSDTWGFSQGETDKAKTPIAVAGRVLVYPYQNRNNYKPGDCVCAAPGGTIDIMTREEVIQWPDRIVGTVSAVPNYDAWGGGEQADRDPVQVNGRIWIKVR